MGARLLRDWFPQPLASIHLIQQRQQAVKTLVENSSILGSLRGQLANVRDLERTLGRLSSGSGNARDLVALRMALEQIPALKQTLETVGRDSVVPKSNLLSESMGSTESRPTSLISGLDSQISESP